MTRFSTETTLAILALLPNSLVPLAICQRKKRLSIYNTFFVNLSIANCFVCVGFWSHTNIRVVFRQEFEELRTYPCVRFMVIIAMMYLSWAFAMVSMLTMLGFNIIQYFAICRPLQHVHVLSRGRIYASLIMTWAISFTLFSIPPIVMVSQIKIRQCEDWLIELASPVLTFSNYVMAVMNVTVYLTIVSLSFRNYHEIRKSRKKTTEGNSSSSNVQRSFRNAQKGVRHDYHPRAQSHHRLCSLVCSLHFRHLLAQLTNPPQRRDDLLHDSGPAHKFDFRSNHIRTASSGIEDFLEVCGESLLFLLLLEVIETRSNRSQKSTGVRAFIPTNFSRGEPREHTVKIRRRTPTEMII